jgi:hypothetical protein
MVDPIQSSSTLDGLYFSTGVMGIGEKNGKQKMELIEAVLTLRQPRDSYVSKNFWAKGEIACTTQPDLTVKILVALCSLSISHTP